MLSLNLIVFFTWFFLLFTDKVFGTTDYCKFSSKHMLCGGGGFDPKCGGKGNYIYTDITESEIEKVLDYHNKYRNELALGRVTGGGGKSYPKASNMEELIWDSELANVAAGMVKKCTFEHHCPGDPSCIRTDRFKAVGENIFSQWSTESLEEMVKQTTIEKAPHAWFFDEKDFYDPADIPKFNADKNSLGKSNKDHGHFTQMIWWNVRRVGCAKIGFKSSKPKFKSQIIITCHYGPAGNYIGSTIYEKGEPCTKCSGQGRTCSTKYKGLCGRSFFFFF
ncbi:UNVERIFIED_CONTAM: hypothetical protein RMT77_007482 [Armadillidium vulgare]